MGMEIEHSHYSVSGHFFDLTFTFLRDFKELLCLVKDYKFSDSS